MEAHIGVWEFGVGSNNEIEMITIVHAKINCLACQVARWRQLKPLFKSYHNNEAIEKKLKRLK